MFCTFICGKALRQRIFTKFCISGDMPDVIICANFGSEKLRGLGYTGGQILGSPIEMAGHWSPLQQCCAIMQLVICTYLLWCC